MADDDWNFYLCNVNDGPASIFLNLGLRKSVPDPIKPNLLWIWVYLKWPREDGLSDSSEFDSLKTIEDGLTEALDKNLEAVLCGRITTDGRREFYYYAPRAENLEPYVEAVMSPFEGYDFECGSKADPEWKHYLDVLYPSDEDRQRMENRKVLDVLERHNDTLQKPRDVWHWMYFRTPRDREDFRRSVLDLEYRIQSESQRDRVDLRFGICVVRFQSVKPSDIDDAVIELCRLAKKHRGDYDGWETQVSPPEKS